MAIATTVPPAPSDDKRWRIVETRMRRLGQRPDVLIEVLHAAQEAFGYLDTDTMEFVARSLGVPLSKVYGVATFYSFFTLKPRASTPASSARAPPATSTGLAASSAPSAAGWMCGRGRPPPTGGCRC